jgi:hypothetical protein
MTGFLQYTLICTSIYSIILIYLLHKTTFRNNESVKPVLMRQNYYISLIFGLSILCIPVSFYITSVPYSYPSPDTYNYVIASDMESWDSLPIDTYYKPYPIYVILSKFVSIITGLNYSLSISLLHIPSLLLVLLGIVLIIKFFSKERTSIEYTLLYTFIIVNSIYLYSYLNNPIPQVFSLWVFAFMIYTLLNNMRISFILFSALAIVHAGTIPFFLIISAITLMRSITLNQHNKWMRKLILATIPLILHIGYITYSSYNPNIINPLYDYLHIMYKIIFEPEKVGLVLFTSSAAIGLQHQHPLLRALSLSSYLSLTVIGLYLIFLRKKEYPLIISSLCMLGILLLFIGFAKYYIVTEIPSYSVARYVNVYGFYFLSIFNAYTLYLIFEKCKNRGICYAILIILSIGLLGSFTDPFTFPYKPSAGEVESMKIISQVIIPEIPIYSNTIHDHYYFMPQLYFWIYNEEKVPKLNYKDVLRAGVDEKYSDITFSTTFHYVYLLKSTSPSLVIAGFS